MSNLLHCLVWNVIVSAVAVAILWPLCLTPWLRRRPALRHTLWVLVLLKLATPPLAQLPVLPATEPAARPDSVPPAGMTPGFAAYGGAEVFSVDTPPTRGVARSVRWKTDLLPAAAGGSILVTCVLLIVAVNRGRTLNRLAQHFAPASRRTQSILNNVAADFGMRRAPQLAVVDAACSPMLWVRRGTATILLPELIEQSADEQQLQHVLGHEVAHLVRHDAMVNRMTWLVCCVFWWNPAAWLARREILATSEYCCDALVIERSRTARSSYAKTLLAATELAGHAHAWPSAMVIPFSLSHSLKRRVEMIACPSVKSALSGRHRLLLMSTGLVALMILPVQAQSETPRQEEPRKTSVPSLAPLLLSGADGSQRDDESVSVAATPADTSSDPDAAGADEATSDSKQAKQGTSAFYQPSIGNARLVAFGWDTSSRAYYFESQEVAESFARTIAAFQIATRFEVVISDEELSLFDVPNKKIVTPWGAAHQLGLDTDRFVLLDGTNKQHEQVEAIVKALGLAD